ncbi:hypothetical protein [Methylobacterium sp. JK268]
MPSDLLNVVADANVLWSPHQRNLLLQLAHQDVFRVFWTDLVIEEWLRNVEPDQRTRCERRTVPLMRRHFPDAWLPAIAAIPFGRTDPKDRHVAAAAVHVAPSVLVTWNLTDFDVEALGPHGVEVLSPDRFLKRILDRDSAAVLEFTRQAQVNLTRTAPTSETYKSLLRTIGLTTFVAGVETYESDPASDDADGDIVLQA